MKLKTWYVRVCASRICSTEGCPHDLDLRPEVDKRVTASEAVVIDLIEAAGKGSMHQALNEGAPQAHCGRGEAMLSGARRKDWRRLCSLPCRQVLQRFVLVIFQKFKNQFGLLEML